MCFVFVFLDVHVLISIFNVYMGVSKNKGTPKWMVKKWKTLIRMDDLGVSPLFSETPIYMYIYIYIYKCIHVRYIEIEKGERGIHLDFPGMCGKSVKCLPELHPITTTKQQKA